MDNLTKNQDTLKDLLSQKAKLLNQAKKLTQQHQQLIEQEKINEFAQSIKKRQDLIDGAEKVQVQINSVIQQNSSQQNQEIAELFAKSDEIINEIVEMDKQSSALAEQFADKIKQQMQNLNQSRKTMKSYGQVGVVDSSEYFDKKQ